MRRQLEALKPPPKQTISQWADAKRILSAEAAAEPGAWRTTRAEYQRGVMDAITDPRVTDVVLMTSAQVGKSEILLNAVGYYIEYQPAPMMMVQPTVELAQAFSKDRVAPMLRDTPTLRERVADAKTRDSGNTVLHKQFKGGRLTLAGANSPANLASRPIRILLADEVDKYPISAGPEGDPLALAEKRTQTFWNKKRIKCSTPTIKDLSRIEAAYNESDKRRYFVPCGHCGEFQTLSWKSVQWPKDEPEKAQYACSHCGALWSETERHRAVRRGEWRASAPFRGTAGFHLNELYSPWSTLPAIAEAFLAAEKYPERLKTWVNTALGETWDDAHVTQDPAVLKGRAEDYELRTAPAGALLIVASVDVQGDRLECYTWGYGLGEEAWVLDFEAFYGDPARSIVWDQLLEHLARPLKHELGAPAIARCVAIDSGGLHTQVVYAFCRNNAARYVDRVLQKIIAVKGQSEAAKPIIGKPTLQDIDLHGEKIKKGVQLWPVGSSSAKHTLYGRLNIEAPGPGYVHTSSGLPEDFWEQLISEKLVTRYVRGYPVMEWHLPRGRRNEALDCAVYAYAAACSLGMLRMRRADWDKARAILMRARPAAEEPAEVLPPPTPAPPTQAQRYDPRRAAFGRQPGGFVTNWRK